MAGIKLKLQVYKVSGGLARYYKRSVGELVSYYARTGFFIVLSVSPR